MNVNDLFKIRPTPMLLRQAYDKLCVLLLYVFRSTCMEFPPPRVFFPIDFDMLILYLFYVQYLCELLAFLLPWQESFPIWEYLCIFLPLLELQSVVLLLGVALL